MLKLILMWDMFFSFYPHYGGLKNVRWTKAVLTASGLIRSIHCHHSKSCWIWTEFWSFYFLFSGLHSEALGLRASKRRTRRRRNARVDTGDGHARVRGTRVHNDRSFNGKEWRVQLWSGVAWAIDGSEIGGQKEILKGTKPRWLGSSNAQRGTQTRENNGPEAWRSVLRDGSTKGSGFGLSMPKLPTKEQAMHKHRCLNPPRDQRLQQWYSHWDIHLHGLFLSHQAKPWS